MGKSELITLLNEALIWEYTDIFLYLRQSGIVQDDKISKTFERLAYAEMRHTDTISIQINVLGGKPNWELDYPIIEGGTDEILRDHLNREEKAIQAYESLIELAEKEREHQLKLDLQTIKSEEESHLATIKQLLEKRRQSKEG